MFICISIKSKNKKSLNFFLDVFKNLNLTQNYKIMEMKKNYKRFTVLKSPHVNKTAQEHFEFILFSKNIEVRSFQIFKILMVLKKIKTSLCWDVSLRLKFFIDTSDRKKNLFKNKLVLRKTFVKLSNEATAKTKLNLLNLNFYGKSLFTKTSLNSSVGRAKD